MNHSSLHAIALLTLLLLASCATGPKSSDAVTDFELNRYLGTWYEIARLDHRFERDLDNVTTTYSSRDDGRVSVLNKGRSIKTGEWNEAAGKAYFVKDPATAHLKVSFFGPFYGSYVILELDELNYSYALVAGPNANCLWILARESSLDDTILQTLINAAREKGYPVDDLIMVNHAAAT